jgi:GDP-4-dehydro-6-deoxy-D-mannose reductase
VQRVLITGARGFAGRHLRVALERHGHEPVPSAVDVRDTQAVAEEMRTARPDAVAHLAAVTSVAESWKRERDVWEVNALGTLNVVLAVVAHAPAARVLVTSSAEVYGRAGDGAGLLDEDAPVAPISPYGRSKAATEIACARDDLDLVVARPFPHTGPGQSEAFAIPSFAGQIARIEAGQAPAVIRVGNLTARRDYLDVRCVVEAYVLLLEDGGGSRVVNVASGTAHPMRALLDKLIALATVDIEIAVDESRLRPDDVPLLLGSPRRLKDQTGWQATRSLDETLADVLNAARQRVGVE